MPLIELLSMATHKHGSTILKLCPLSRLHVILLQGPAASSFEKFSLMKTYMRGAHAALRKQNCYPWRTFATPVMMMPFFVGSVLGARHLVMMGDASFETGRL